MQGSGANVLVVYSADAADQASGLAHAIGSGASSEAANVRILDDRGANYERDVLDWADALVLGSGVYNGNAAPSLLAFINTFNFMDDLSSKIGGAFATGGSAAAGLQPTLESINRGLETFRFMVVGGSDWKNGEGTGVVVNGSEPILNTSKAWQLGFGHGARVARVAATIARGGGIAAATPAPQRGNGTMPGPPRWGALWSGSVSANLTQVGYDAGLVIVNFTAACHDDPQTQKMLTVYGDFYTVLTRCDLGREFTIAPKSRGGKCTTRKIGVDIGSRICEACGCPFCVRDTNGTFSAGIGDTKTVTLWDAPKEAVVHGEEVIIYNGRANGVDAYDLQTSIAYTKASGGTVPLFVNVSHPLWVSTAAKIAHYTTKVDEAAAFAVPGPCYS